MILLRELFATRKPVPLGTVIAPWGKVASVGCREGERYYMLVDKHGTVALMPADVIEGAVQSKSSPLTLHSDRVPELPSPELPGSKSAALKKILEGKSCK